MEQRTLPRAPYIFRRVFCMGSTHHVVSDAGQLRLSGELSTSSCVVSWLDYWLWFDATNTFPCETGTKRKEPQWPYLAQT